MKTKKLNAKDFAMKTIKIKDIINFLEGLKEFRVDEKLPFGTCDYYYIDDFIDVLTLIDTIPTLQKEELKEAMKKIHIAIRVCNCMDYHTCPTCQATEKAIDKVFDK